jgi:hypothetical protein
MGVQEILKPGYFIEWFMEGSQRALFSMLFGAGIFLFISRQEKKVDGPLAREIIFSAATMAPGVWIVQCLRPAMVLGYFISLCLRWYDPVYL